MEFSTLFNLSSSDLNSEAEVETRLLAILFEDLGYPQNHIIPKSKLNPLVVQEGSKKYPLEVDFILTDPNDKARILVEAKDPSKNVHSAWGQAASYTLSYNRDKSEEDRIKWLLISNGHITSLYSPNYDTPTITLRLSDFASGSPPYVNLRTTIKFAKPQRLIEGMIPFESLTQDALNTLFFECHELIWKKEKYNPTDAFFEFCKFIFVKIREDKKREGYLPTKMAHTIPLTLAWLKSQKETTKHPIRDVLFSTLRNELETAINKDKKKRIFEPQETLRLSASTCEELVKRFEPINLSSIDEDLNGRMFEVFLAAAVRGRELGQYFTPRPVVDFMTRIALHKKSASKPPKVIDACAGTAGFLIEVMAYLISGLREDKRFTEDEKDNLAKAVCNQSIYGIEANERVSRIARINMHLHGDGGSHVFHGDGLDESPLILDDMSDERTDEVKDHQTKILSEQFDLVLSNPPFSMVYRADNQYEKRILKQYGLKVSSGKSNVLFLYRYHQLLKPGGEILIVLDDTILNGTTNKAIRDWFFDHFILLGVHSLPFNTFFKARANIKTSILHGRKKKSSSEKQGHVFMSISNNIGHDNALKDTPSRNNLTDILNAYLEWQRTGEFHQIVKKNQDMEENLECPEQVWLTSPEELTTYRFDSFFYAPLLKECYTDLIKREKDGEIQCLKASKLTLKKKLSRQQKKDLIDSKQNLKYIEIGDVTQYGLITKWTCDTYDRLPTRGGYQISEGDILMAINNSSRGTVVRVPKEFDGAICTSGFLVIEPNDKETSYLLWYALRSEYCRDQIYYLAQTASQPELKMESWNKKFIIPMPIGITREKSIKDTKKLFEHIDALLGADNFRFK